MARYAMVEGIGVANVIEFDPEVRRLPLEVERDLVEVPLGVRVEAGWTWNDVPNDPVFFPPLNEPVPREATTNEVIEDLDGQVAALQLQATATEAEADSLREDLAALTERVKILER